MSNRIPIEFTSSTNEVIRGIQITRTGANPILLVHSFDADLDEFGSLPEQLHARGYEPIAIDLIGHGLSDGEHELSRVHADVRSVVQQIASTSRAIGCIMSGRTATVGAHIGRDENVVAQVFVNPELDDEMKTGETRKQSIRLLIHGDDPNVAATKTKSFFSYLLGEKMMVLSSDSHLGLAQLSKVDHIRNHMEIFFHRYLSQKSETKPMAPSKD
jgi:pimeloyl-ACP methyl ester carboxylesterase